MKGACDLSLVIEWLTAGTACGAGGLQGIERGGRVGEVGGAGAERERERSRVGTRVAQFPGLVLDTNGLDLVFLHLPVHLHLHTSRLHAILHPFPVTRFRALDHDLLRRRRRGRCRRARWRRAPLGKRRATLGRGVRISGGHGDG